MSLHTIRSSRPDVSVLPRAHTDAHQRMHTYGPVLPMDHGEQSQLAKWSGRLTAITITSAVTWGLFHVARLPLGIWSVF